MKSYSVLGSVVSTLSTLSLTDYKVCCNLPFTNGETETQRGDMIKVTQQISRVAGIQVQVCLHQGPVNSLMAVSFHFQTPQG